MTIRVPLLFTADVPSFSISREPGFGFPILEKMPVSLHCAVDANPPCPPQWLKDDGPPPVEQSPDGYLNFSSIERQHAGWYRCAAVHTLGTFASFGYFLNVRCEWGNNTPYIFSVTRTGELRRCWFDCVTHHKFNTLPLQCARAR